MYQIEPLQVVNFTVEEARLSELKFEKEGEVNTQARAPEEAAAPDEDSEEQEEEQEEGDQNTLLPSDVELAVMIFQELQHFFVEHFDDQPIPKQHFLAFHATTFLENWLSLGMFAEQVVESVHAMFNALRRKYKMFGREGSWVQSQKFQNAMYDCQGRHKRKGTGRKWESLPNKRARRGGLARGR